MTKKPLNYVPGFGARLRARLKAAGMTQTELSRAAGISRQTIAQALADRVSQQTAGLIDDVLPAGTSTSRPDAWATATQIADWSNRRDSQAELPRLIRRLVLVTTADAHTVSFRADEGIQLAGVDGRVATDRGSAFVPAGDSVWELGTGADPARKAMDDYAKRTTEVDPALRANSTFVFVTTRRWAGRDEWIEARRNEKAWRDVRAYDADDLEAWLEEAPSVHLWFSLRIDATPHGCTDLETWWGEWQHATNPVLTSGFMLSGRDAAAKEIVSRLGNPEHVFAVKAESRDESIAFFASTIETADAVDRDITFARSIVVHAESAWRHLAASKNPLILIPTFDVSQLIASATKRNHTVVVPLGAGDLEPDAYIGVGPIAREPIIDFLNPGKTGPRDEAWEKASLARRSMTAFRRSIAVAPSLRKPAWADPAIARNVIGALLLSSWNEAHPGDKEALEALTGRSYGEAVGALLPWTNTTDPLLRRRGTLWYLVSTEDAWRQIGAFVSRDDLVRLETFALRVFGVVDPRLDLAPEKRWMAGMLLERPPYSVALRRGLAETIGLLGSRAGEDEPGFRNDDLTGFASGLLQRVFANVRAEPRLWASIDDHLPDLAEGAPDVFLRELEHELDDPAQPLRLIFTDDASGGLFGPSSPHVHVLWALERLAWSPRYLGRVVQILGRLDAIDPKGKMVNRPAATLRAIFLPWLPQTAATADKRIEVLETWSSKDPRAAWTTLVSMLPEMHGIGHYSSGPRWHDWRPDESKGITHGEYWKSVHFAASKLIALAGDDSNRWKDLVPALSQFPEPELNLALAKLTQLDVAGLPEATRAAIWDGLRTLVAHHRHFAHADWAMPAERVSAIDAILERFSPQDVVARFAWLFGHRPELPDATSRMDDFAAYDAEIARRRGEAAHVILSSGGLSALDRVAERADDPQSLGFAVAKLGTLPQEDDFIEGHLAHERRELDLMAWGYLSGRLSGMSADAGWGWIHAKFIGPGQSWSPAQRASLLLCIRPTTRDSWALADADPLVAAEYWKRLHPFVVEDADIADAARRYLTHGRNFAAVELIGHHAQKAGVGHALILEVLNAAVFAESTDKPDGMFTYYVEKLFDALGDVSGEEETLVGRLEWGLLPAISRHERSPKILTRVMLRDPELFVEAVTLVYRPHNSAKEDAPSADEEGRTKASRAYELLRSIRGIPGTKPDGTIDRDALRAWVTKARAELVKHDRLETGMQEIGQMIGATPTRGSDNVWPCEAVRDLVEAEESPDLEQGVRIGLYNSRGVTTRSVTTGGGPERALASQYEQYAKAVESRWHRTGEMLRAIAATFSHEADHHDLDVAVQEDLGV
jgi:transcriptional regulator with XRE-family HTH domain